jgi:hypothetical protein
MTETDTREEDWLDRLWYNRESSLIWSLAMAATAAGAVYLTGNPWKGAVPAVVALFLLGAYVLGGDD